MQFVACLWLYNTKVLKKWIEFFRKSLILAVYKIIACLWLYNTKVLKKWIEFFRKSLILAVYKIIFTEE